MQACSSRESVVWLKRRSRNERNCRPAADSAQAVARKGIYDEVVHHFQSSGLEPRVVCECHDSTTLLSLVTSGFGATILPLSMLPAHFARHVQTLEIQNNPFILQPSVVWRAGSFLPKPVREFWLYFDKRPGMRQ